MAEAGSIGNTKGGDSLRIGYFEGEILVAEPGDRYKALSRYMRWDKRTKCMRAKATLDTLEGLAGIFTLPPNMMALRERLKAKQSLIDHIRADENPKPLMELPVKAKLYKHQIKAVNMALVEFDVLGGDANAE